MKKLLLTTNDGLIMLSEHEIYFVKSENIYTNVYLGSENHFTTCSLKKIESLLDPARFYRCHKSYIVNLNRILKITKAQNCHLVLTNGAEIPVSRSKKKELMQIILLLSKNQKPE